MRTPQAVSVNAVPFNHPANALFTLWLRGSSRDDVRHSVKVELRAMPVNGLGRILAFEPLTFFGNACSRNPQPRRGPRPVPIFDLDTHKYLKIQGIPDQPKWHSIPPP